MNEDGIPCCPKDPSLLLKKEGNNTAFLKNGIARQKFICPLTHGINAKTENTAGSVIVKPHAHLPFLVG